MAVDYNAFYRTGAQDASNVFTPSEDIDIYVLADLSGSKYRNALREQLRDFVMDLEDFTQSFELEDDVNPLSAYRHWRTGWITRATQIADEAVKRLREEQRE